MGESRLQRIGRDVSLPRIAACCVLALAASAACAQNYPVRPIRIITAGVGGGNDLVSRLIAQGISGPLGQQVVVENRSGGLVAFPPTGPLGGRATEE